MKIRAIAGALTARFNIVYSYVRCAPAFSALPYWFFLGLIRSRLLGGKACMPPSRSQAPRYFRMPIGPVRDQAIVIDLTSMAELDVFQEVVVEDIYSLASIETIPRLVLDCGANIGCFASLCRVVFPDADIVCWEPEPRNFQRLKGQPLLQDAKTRLFQAAVAVDDGELQFSGGDTGGLIVAKHGVGTQSVRAISLRKWLEENSESPALMKIDIEGYEESLLPTLAGIWPKSCVLLLETHRPGGDDGAVLQHVEREGFDCVLTRSHSLPHDVRVFKEYLAVRN